MIKNIFLITIVSLLLLVAVNCFAADKYQWKFAGTEHNCQIYTSAVPGKDYIAAKTSCVIPARKEVLGVILRDIENYPEWMEDCKETKILKTVDDQNDVFIFWFRQHIPLFTDRDMVLISRLIIDPPKGLDFVYADSTDEIRYDAGKGYVRMPSFSSLWILEWIDREHTMVTFMIDPDLDKGLPKNIANATIKKLPYKSLKRLMKIVKKPKYIEAAKTSKYYKLVEDNIKAGYVK
jgi:hypothetical protein